MGNKTSTSDAGEGEGESSTGGVKMREKRGNAGGGRSNRPLSDPGVSMFPEVRASTLPNPKLRRASEDPAASGLRSSFRRQSDGTGLPRQVEELRPTSKKGIKKSFELTLSEVISTWPEYQPIRAGDVTKQKTQVVDALDRALCRLLDQHRQVTHMMQDRQGFYTEIKELASERDQQQQMLQKRADEIDQLQADVAILVGELKKRGIAPKLSDDRRTSCPDGNSLGVYHSRDTSTASRESVDSLEHAEKLRSKERAGYLKATPMKLAEGERFGINATPALKSVSGSSTPRGAPSGGNTPRHSPPGEDSVFSDELVQKFANLHNQERRRSLDDHLGGQKRASAYLPVDYIIGQYRHLETEALTKVSRTVDQYASYATSNARRRFICATFEVAFQESEKLTTLFQRRFKQLLTNPTAPVQASSELSEIVDIMDRRQVFEQEKKSKLGLRAYVPGEIPEGLIDNIRSYMVSVSDQINLEPLVERVCARLRTDFVNCASNKLLAESFFNHFIHECCRLAWQLNIVTPVMPISTNMTSRWPDDKLHTVLNLDAARAASNSASGEVDYFVWPILYSKKHGDVLHRGTVVLKQGGNKGLAGNQIKGHRMSTRN